MPDTQEVETVVRRFFQAYTDNAPEIFDEVVSPRYQDYGHDPVGVGPQGAKDDLAGAIEMVGGVPSWTIDAMAADPSGWVAAQWTGTTPGGQEFRGVSLYLVQDGQLQLTRHDIVGGPPA